MCPHLPSIHPCLCGTGDGYNDIHCYIGDGKKNKKQKNTRGVGKHLQVTKL